MPVGDATGEAVLSMTVIRTMAKRFRFRLGVVERVRRQTRDQHRRIVVDAVRAARQMEDHITALNDQSRRCVDEMILAQGDARLNVALVRSQEFHRNWLYR